MEIDLFTPTLLFPTISLVLLAFTHRFLASLIQQLRDDDARNRDQNLLEQICGLRGVRSILRMLVSERWHCPLGQPMRRLRSARFETETPHSTWYKNPVLYGVLKIRTLEDKYGRRETSNRQQVRVGAHAVSPGVLGNIQLRVGSRQ
jgi:hypothetical protein